MRLSTDKLILVGLVIFTLAEALTHYGEVYPDSPGYFAAAHFFQGRVSSGMTNFRLLRPLTPFLASLVNYFLNIRSAFAIVNLGFWCAGAVLMFSFTKLLTNDTYASLLSSALFTSAIPMLLFADAALTDMGGYFFILLSTYLIIKWDIPRAHLGQVCLVGMALGVGFLARESVASAIIFGLAWTFWSSRSITRATLLFVIPLAISMVWSYAVGISYVAWYNHGGLAYAMANQPITPSAKLYMLGWSIQYSFGRYPEVLALGALGLLGTHDRSSMKIHISIWLGAFAIIFAWPIIDTRFSFILFPSVFPLAGLGLERAYQIIFRSRLVREIWPSFPDTIRAQFGFLLIVLAFYVLTTNLILRHYISLPWMPYTYPSVRVTDIA